jgi:hypothetical protein
VVQLDCPAGEPWTDTQPGATLAACFDPSPPRLGERGIFTVRLVDSAGAPIADASITLTLVGGMAGMEGEHDEDFSVDLVGQGDGVYSAESAVGPSDLVLTGVVIRVRRASAEWSFSIRPAELPSP